MASIQLQNVIKRYGGFIGVQDMNLEIEDEEFLVLLGPSGCGKTTTMRMIAGLEEPTEGRIVIGGEEVNEVDARDRDVAMVFQGYALYPNMSIYENIRFPLRMRGIPKREQDQMISAPRRWWNSAASSTAGLARSRAGRGSGRRWRGQSCGNRGYS